MKNENKHYMNTELSYYMGLIIFLVLVIFNVFDVIKAGSLSIEGIVSYAMIVVFGGFDILILFLIVQTRRNISYIEFTEKSIILHTLFGKSIEARLKGKIEYKMKKKKLKYIYLYDKSKSAQIIISDSYDIPLVDIKRKIEMFRSK